MEIHPSDLLLRETFQEPTSSCERVLEHLKGCAPCQKRLRGLLSSFWAGKPTDYEPAFERSFRFLETWQRKHAKERAEASSLLSILLSHPPERQKLLLRNHPRFQTWGLLEILLRRSYEVVFEDSVESEKLARLGLILSDCLDVSHYRSERIEDMRAQAWGSIANSRRVRGELSEADQAFESALHHLREGTGDSLDRAAYLQLKASLRREQGRFADAARLLKRAIPIFSQAGHEHDAGKSLISLSVLHYAQGEREKEIRVLREAIPLLNPDREPRTLLCAWHNLADNLATSGRIMEAQGVLAKTRPLYRQFPESWTQSRLQWVEGKILRGLGRIREARATLLMAHEGFISANRPVDAALLHSEITALPTC